MADKQSLRDFIDAYRDVPPLWKVKSDCYKNKQLKEEFYKKLTEILKANDPDASIANTKRKINSLRSAYRRELKNWKSAGNWELDWMTYIIYQHYVTSITWNLSASKKNMSTVIHPKDYDA
jgi:hypothetical protein